MRAAQSVTGCQYNCGGCGARNNLKPSDPIRCRTCGYRILYKVRTTKCKFT